MALWTAGRCETMDLNAPIPVFPEHMRGRIELFELSGQGGPRSDAGLSRPSWWRRALAFYHALRAGRSG